MRLSNEAKVGFLFLAGILLFGWLTFMAKGGLQSLFPEGRTLQASFNDVKGLKVSDKVFFAGVPVGKVTDILFEKDRLVVTMTIDEPGVVIYEGRSIRVEDASALGGKRISITRGDPRAPEINWSEVQPGTSQDTVTSAIVQATEQFESLISQNSRAIQKITSSLAETTRILSRVAGDLEKGQGTVGLLLTDERLYENLNQSTSRLAEVFGSLARGEGTLGRLFTDRDIYDRLDLITKHLVAGKGTLGRLIFDDRFFQRFEGALENTDSILRKVNEGQGSLGLFVNDEGLYRNLERITRKLANSEGTLGKLLGDDGLYVGLEKISQNLEGITRNLNNISDKVDKGRGSLSRLISEDTLYKKAEEAVEKANDILGTFSRFKTFAGVSAKYHSEQDMTVYRLYLRVEPSRDKFFHFGVSWLGLTRGGEVDYAGRNDGDGTDDYFLFFEALVGFRFFDFLTVRLGMLEGQVGGGLDMEFPLPYLHDTPLRFTVEARTSFADTDFDGSEINENIEPVLLRFEMSVLLFRHIRLFVGGNNLRGVFEDIAWSAGVAFEYNEEDVRNLLGLLGLAG